MKKIIRKPILNPKKILIMKGKEYLEYYNTLGDATEEDILEVSYYYDFKSRQVCNTTGFRSLSLKDYTAHKNWKFFAKLFNLCIENNWDYKIYIDAQFERASYWKHTKRPYPSQLTSESCQKYYLKYISTKEEECRADGTKVKAKKSVDLYTEIEDSLIKDCLLIKQGIKYLKGNDTLSDKKTTVLFENLLSLSPYYIFSVKWMVLILDEYIKANSNDTLLEIKAKINFIEKSPKVSSFIYKTIKIIENQMKLPKTVSEKEILNN